MTRMTGPDCAVMCNLITSEVRVTNRRSDGKKGRKKRAPSLYWPIISLKTTVRTVLPIYSGARDPSGER